MRRFGSRRTGLTIGGRWPWLAVAALIGLTACDQEKTAQAPDPRPVRTVTAKWSDSGEVVVLTGTLQAENEPTLAFRIGGRMIERPVNVGDRVVAGQEIARLDPQSELYALRAAQAQLAARQAQLTQSRSAFERQRILLAQGHTPRAQFDLAEKALNTALAQVDEAEAQVRTAAIRVSYTVLIADAPGAITARGAEPGEVVQPGQMIVQLAREVGLDAVFDVPASVLQSAPTNPEIAIRLTGDPATMAKGRVREIAPQADPVTRTFRVKIGLTDPPAAMRLGSTVSGTLRLEADRIIAIPASALTEFNRLPAVWIVDPVKLTVSLRNIETLRFDPGTVVVAHGLDTGDIVVTAGVQALHPGQVVRLLGPAS